MIIRLLTGDDPSKQARSRQLFEQVERRTLSVTEPATVIADAVYVLSSLRLYGQSREEVAAGVQQSGVSTVYSKTLTLTEFQA